MALKGNEFRKFFDGNTSYMSGYDFTVTLGAGTKVATITGLPFTLTVQSVVAGMFWDITNEQLIPNESIVVTTGPDTITFTNAEAFVGTEEVIFILKGDARPVVISGMMIDVEFDTIDYTYNASQNPTKLVISLLAVVQLTIDITYDADENISKIVRS